MTLLLYDDDLPDIDILEEGFIKRPIFTRNTLFREELEQFVGKWAEGKTGLLESHIKESIELYSRNKELFFEGLCAYGRKVYGIDKEEITEDDSENT